MGTVDDTSYTRSAQLLAQTGHIIYNGWATAMLGWHLYWGALFIKLFGFSFNVTRLSTLPLAMVTAFLVQRSMVRAGLSEWNATLANLTLVLSPLFLSLTFSYMTDIGGFLVLVLCFYGCLRALTAPTDRSACLWLAFSALTNGVGGSIRQISWLGLLVMIPSTLWLLRKRRKVLLWGCLFLLCGFAMMLGTMEWYKHQPLTTSEHLWLGALTRDRVRATVQYMVRLVFDAPVFLLPILLPFLPAVKWRDRKNWLSFLAACLGICVGLFVVQRQIAVWLEPSIGDYVTKTGVLGATGINGERPVILPGGIRLLLTVLVIAGSGALIAVLRDRRAVRNAPAKYVLRWPEFFLLAVPFSAVYLALLISRAGINMIFDRYLIPLLFLVLIVLVRLYQERISRQLPRYSLVMIAIVAIYSVGVTHDAFAMLRARLAAASQLQARGVPDDQIDGGWEFDTWTALNHSVVLKPYEGDANARPNPTDSEFACAPPFAGNIGGLHPRYTLSYDPNGCGGQVGVPPVQYREWFGPRSVNIYVVSSARRPIKLDDQSN